MKKTKNILITAICALSFITQAQTSEKREVSSFTKIQAEGAIEIIYKSSEATSLSLEGDASELKNVETTVKNNVLIVKTNGNFKHPVKLSINNKMLKLLSLRGACNFTALNEIKADTFSILSDGASKIEMPLSAKKIITNIHGASEISLSGTTQSFNATLEGASNLKAYALKSATTSIVAKGASSAKVFASQKLSADCAGASHVKFKGDPKDIYKRTTDVSQIDNVN